jgi:hypothetical protein
MRAFAHGARQRSARQKAIKKAQLNQSGFLLNRL